MADEKWIAEFLELVASLPDIPLDYFPVYVSLFFADENVQLMSCEQRGAYLQLLMRGWQQSPPASIPDDDVKIARWTDLTKKRWEGMREIVLRPFTKHTDGRLYQKRLTKVWTAMARKYLARKRGADKANEVIAGKRSADAGERSALSERDAEPTLTQRTNPIDLTHPPNPLIEQIKPNPPTDVTHSALGGGSSSSEVGGGNLGSALAGVLPRQPAVESILKGIGMNGASIARFQAIREATPERLKAEIADIEKKGNADCVAAVLASRFFPKNGRKSP